MPAALHHVKYGSGENSLVILHGLFGSSRNWSTFARNLSPDITVYAVDMRNHGDSPHTETHSLNDMRDDLLLFLKENKIKDPVILGHSMGGFAAMALALTSPDSAKAVIIEDIAPKYYSPGHENEFKALNIDLSGLSSRSQIDEKMSVYVKNASIRQFLQMNLTRKEDVYEWKLNVPVLEKSRFIEEFAAFDGLTYEKPALFVTGDLSPYVLPEDAEIIHAYFPEAEIHELKNADHWLHYSRAEEFLSLVRSFLSGLH